MIFIVPGDSHSSLCALALFGCCLGIATARNSEERNRYMFEQTLWLAARKAVEN